MASDVAVLSVKHVQKKFGNFEALKDVTFDVHKGEVFGFIGPNGAGKTTTIRTVLGIIKASSGSATIFGEDVWKKRVSIHKRLAYVPGDVYLWPNLTGGEIIDLFLKMNDDKHTSKTDDLIKKFELDVTKKARTYSKGNRQKVALIAALSADSDFYIFDEPTSGLDPLNEEMFQKEVLQLKQQGKSILLSSHILSEVEKMCDRIGIIREGQIIETGTLDEMRHLTRTQITVKTVNDPSNIKDLTGVHDFTIDESDKSRATFAVDSESMEAVMKALVDNGIVTLQSTPPTLEDLFLRYYKQDTDPNEVSDHEK